MSEETCLHIAVLRLGFRPHRDARVNTHLCLTARAFGAERIYFTGKDSKLIESIEKVVKNFGGQFKVEVEEKWKHLLQNFDGVKVHLTMYGENLNNIIKEIQMKLYERKNLLVVVGGEKVPKEVYESCHFNVAIGNQPHSEIAALAVFLHRLQQGRELEKKFNGKIQIEPYRNGKKRVIFKNHDLDDDNNPSER